MWSCLGGSSVVAFRFGCLVAAVGLLLVVGSCGGAEMSPASAPVTSAASTPETSLAPAPVTSATSTRVVSTVGVEGMLLQASQAPGDLPVPVRFRLVSRPARLFLGTGLRRWRRSLGQPGLRLLGGWIGVSPRSRMLWSR